MARAFDGHRAPGAIAALCLAVVQPDARKLVETALSIEADMRRRTFSARLTR
jgi:hypothetical protein